MANIANGNLSRDAITFAAALYAEETPNSVEQALRSENWKEAMKCEMNALIKNDTWNKCLLPEGKKLVGCRWLFTIKYKPDVKIERYKARLVAKGYTQTYGIDYAETFSPKKESHVTCLIIYVDDMIVTGDDGDEILQLKKNLSAEFEMKNLGRLKYFLGIEVLRSQQGIFICQKKYILDLLAETGMLECKPSDTPMMVNHGLHMKEDTDLADKEQYQRLFMHKPQVTHMEAVMRIVRYLKGTVGHGVLFKPNGHLETHGYTDTNWAGDKGDRRSTSGYFTFVGGNLVTWRSKKQKVVALSSAEAEFRGVARGLAELLWIRKLLIEIGFAPTKTSKLMCDNEAAIQISENPVQHDHTKHVEMELEDISSDNMEYEEGGDHIEDEGDDLSKEKSAGKRPPKRKYKPRKKKAVVWKYFTQFKDKDGKEKGKCMYCGENICCNTDTHGTSRLNKHLKRCKENPANKEQQAEICVEQNEEDTGKTNQIFEFAFILDPRFKLELIEYAFKKEVQLIPKPDEDMTDEEYKTMLENKLEKMVNDVKAEMQLLVTEYEKIYQTGYSNSVRKESDIATSRIGKNSWMSTFESHRQLLGVQTFGKKSELEKYLKDEVEEKTEDFNILQWWKINASRYPTLAKMAKDILAIPVSSVASESAFSTGGRVIDSYRSSLSPQVVEALICTQDWIRKGTNDRKEEVDDSEKFDELAKDIVEKIESMGLQD
ncbi:hypothetical protein SSX86_016588 [Deinandra increscens subsp. villosa]|uniref:BED-type domain-containing protein n=1 Tax=Deinandra increscens subsp. villosa TaxID=3103831 RepID=A0AAP0H078_9ASTR